ncbi:Serine proteinase inhibitor A3K [Thelohanellus kitauei]|uniref:Serine proteinase inhibitor A3K n=1 Tax=Thelohanellus kitauei TaxID=669202 RepID=A0A0C2MXQ2_THEKT|nr:Serine proteinase inhibitor A3K [Thelohanellus kitauei]
MPADVGNFTSIILNRLFAYQHHTGNVGLSGISLYVMLGIIKFGTKGTSFEQLSNIIDDRFEDIYTENWRRSFASRYWNTLRHNAQTHAFMRSAIIYSCSLYYHYQEISDFLFGMEKIKVNISNSAESAREVDEWVSDNTQISFKNVIDESILSENKIIFINTFSYRSDWTKNFDASLTKYETFYDEKGRQLMVPMMNQQSFNYIYDSITHNFRVLFKSCVQEYVFSAIVLPRQGYKIKDVLKNFNIDEMHTYFMESEFHYVKLKLPRFNISRQTDFLHTFKDFGITNIFDINHSDFGQMTNDTVFIGNIIQVSNLVIDELNDRAIASEETNDDKSLLMPKEFYVKRPFLFFVYVYNNQNVPLGAVVTNPNAT